VINDNVLTGSDNTLRISEGNEALVDVLFRLKNVENN